MNISIYIKDNIEDQLKQLIILLEYKNKYNCDIVFKFNNNFNFNLNNNKNFKLLSDNDYNNLNNIIYIDDNNTDKIFENISDFTYYNLMTIIYSNEDYMYHAYNLYNKIKNNLKDDKDENYICIYIDDTCSNIYYNNAIEEFGKYKKLIIIDEEGIWYDNNKNLYENIYKIDNKNKYLLLILMSFFTNNITSKSLYSFFGSYLNNINKEIIILPKKTNYIINNSIYI